MANKVWVFPLDDGDHTVELEHGHWSGKREITVDGVPLESSRNIIDTGSVHHFQVSGAPCVLHIRASAFSYKYSLYVDGKPV